MIPAEKGKPLPRHKSYDPDRDGRAFWNLSYVVGRAYTRGKDAWGQPTIIKHEREKDAAYARRIKTVKPHNHCGPIIRKYNDFVFRLPPVRPTDDIESGSEYAQLVEDTDGHGTTINDFFRRGLKRAQIEREIYYLPDTNAPTDGRVLTRAQADAAGTRFFIRQIGADLVPWWRDVDGVMIEAVVILRREADGLTFARWFGPTATVDITLDNVETINGKVADWRQFAVTDIGAEQPHNYGGCPLVRQRPLFDDNDDPEQSPGESQISPLAELQQDIANKLSLLDEEITNNVFTQWIASGVDKARVGELEVGNTRIICLPDPAAKFNAIGGDPAQATSIRQQISDTTRELYRVAGVSTSDPLDTSGQVESGVARAFKFNDLAANLSALASSCEAAENLVMDRIYTALGKPLPGSVKYERNFELPDLQAELETVIRAITAFDMPAIIKQKITQSFIDRNLSISEDEKAQVAAQIKALATAPTPTQNPLSTSAGGTAGT